MINSTLKSFLLATALCLLPVMPDATPLMQAAYDPANEVDAVVSLLADISASMTPEEREIQRQGYVAAFRSQNVLQAITEGAVGCIVIQYVEWSEMQKVIVPWTKLCSAVDTLGFAQAIADAPSVHLGSMTNTGDAIAFASAQIQASGYMALKHVIDVSSDDRANQGFEVSEARDAAVALGQTINGLPIIGGERYGIAPEDLTEYFEETVIGGPGAFVLPAKSVNDLPEVITRKLSLEIS